MCEPARGASHQTVVGRNDLPISRVSACHSRERANSSNKYTEPTEDATFSRSYKYGTVLSKGWLTTSDSGLLREDSCLPKPFTIRHRMAAERPFNRGPSFFARRAIGFEESLVAGLDVLNRDRIRCQTGRAGYFRAGRPSTLTPMLVRNRHASLTQHRSFLYRFAD